MRTIIIVDGFNERKDAVLAHYVVWEPARTKREIPIGIFPQPILEVIQKAETPVYLMCSVGHDQDIPNAEISDFELAPELDPNDGLSFPHPTWGVALNSEIPESENKVCPGCGWHYKATIHNRQDFDQIVGFESHPIPETFLVGKLIVECPNCGGKFWWFISEDYVCALAVEDEGLCKAWPGKNRTQPRT